jgi:hypothetical protein
MAALVAVLAVLEVRVVVPEQEEEKPQHLFLRVVILVVMA